MGRVGSALGLMVALAVALLSAQDTAVARVRAWRAQHEPQILRELFDLLAIPNVASNTADIERNAQALTRMFEKRRFLPETIPTGGAPLVVAERRVPNARRTVTFYFHYDGQPVDAREWTHAPPFSPVIVTDVASGGRTMSRTCGRGSTRWRRCSRCPEAVNHFSRYRGWSVMRVAAIYDIHGNLPALEAVLQEIRRADVERIVVGGDVLPGPMPRETIACLLGLDSPVQFIQGNGDREVIAPTGAVPEQFRDGMRWNAAQLPPEYERLLASWPHTLRVQIRGLGEVLFCHATPRNDTEIFTRLTPEERLVPVFEGLNVPMVVCGHTHMQFDRTIGRTRVVNAGSVGMPFQEPGAYWLLLGPDVQLRHTAYDLAKAAERIRDTRYPQAQEFAARNVLQPPSESETLEAFARVELR